MRESPPSIGMIEAYAAGRHMVVAGQRYTHDLKIIGNSVKDNWWRREGHRLAAEDIKDVLSAAPDFLVVGTGYAGRMRIPKSLRHQLEKKHIQVVSEPTAEAIKTFNRLHTEGKNVFGAFHLTC